MAIITISKLGVDGAVIGQGEIAFLVQLEEQKEVVSIVNVKIMFIVVVVVDVVVARGPVSKIESHGWLRSTKRQIK